MNHAETVKQINFSGTNCKLIAHQANSFHFFGFSFSRFLGQKKREEKKIGNKVVQLPSKIAKLSKVQFIFNAICVKNTTGRGGECAEGSVHDWGMVREGGSQTSDTHA